MPRTIETRQELTGIVQQIIDTDGSTKNIDQKVVFGPVFEEYMRENVFLSQLDFTYGDINRKVYKVAYSKDVDSTLADFDPNSKAKGKSTKPEVVLITLANEKEAAAEWYDRDFQESNVLQGVGQKLIDEVMVVSSDHIDKVIGTSLKAEAEANTELAIATLDIDAMEITEANGKIVYEAMRKQLFAFRQTAKTNAYSKSSMFANNILKIEISPKVEELLTAYKTQFLVINDTDKTTMLNSATFGSAFRNVSIKTVIEMPADTHMLIHTNRAVQGTFKASIHTKFIPEATNQTNYMNEYHNVFGYGIKTVFENEVTGIKQAAAGPAPSKPKADEPKK